jgi:hypothetical protein
MGGVSPKFNFSLLAMSHFDWPATKKMKLWRLPKTKQKCGRMNTSPFSPPIELKRGQPWAKHMG